MTTIKQYIATLNRLIKDQGTHKLDYIEISELQNIIKLLEDTFVNRIPRPAPNTPLKIKKKDIKRVLELPLTRILLYIMQENKEPTCYRSVKGLLIECDLLGFHKRAILGNAFKSLMNSGLVVNSSYGIYELTDKGKDFVV